MPNVTIQEQTIDWYGPESNIELFIYVTKPFIPSTGIPVNASSPWDDLTRSNPWRKASCDVDPDAHMLTIEQVALSSTEDAITGSDTTLIAIFMDTSYAIPRMLLGYSVFGGEGPSVSFRVPATPTLTTWAGIAAHMRGETYTASGDTLPFLIRDLFTSGSSNAGRRPTTNRVGSIYSPGAGTFEVHSSDGYLAPASGFADGAYQTIETNHSDVTLYAVLTGYGSSDGTIAMPGLIFRFVDANNFWLVQVNTYVGNVTLYERTGGTFTSRATITASFAAGVPFPLSVTAVGNKIWVELGGQDPVYYTSTQHMTATKVGVRAGKGGGTPAGLPRYEQLTVMPAFVRSENNPLVSPVASSWRSVDVAAPSVFRDTQTAKYVAQISGFDGVKWRSGQFYADSPDGPFTAEQTNPTYAPTVDEGYIAASGGAVVDSDGVYWEVYQGAPDASAGHPDGNWLVYAAKSIDKGLTWTRLKGGDPILPLGASGSFDQDGQHDPKLRIRDDGVFEVLFSGRKGSEYGAGRCIAIDLEACGPTSQLVIQGQFGPGIDIGNVTISGTDPLRYSMYFTKISTAGARHVCQSFTEDGGASWSYLGGVFYPDADVDDEGVQVFDPDTLLMAGREYLYYGAADAPGGIEGFSSVVSVASRAIP